MVIRICAIFFLLHITLGSFAIIDNNKDGHHQLVAFYKTWRAFEQPPLKNGAPDYTQATFTSRMPAFKKLKDQLLSIDTTAWPIEQQADWHLLMAEMNGYDFNYRILQPWNRDPAFYKSVWTERSDVPAHEGPTHHRITELWTYSFPLSPNERARLINSLKVIAPLNEQAKINLTGNARELWIAGIRDIKTQVTDLKELQTKSGVANDLELVTEINKAIESTHQFVQWLVQKSSSKNGPSGVGKENYDWYLKNVHLVPLTWDDQVMLLKRELDRAWTALKMEEHRNRKLPQLIEADSPESYKVLSENAAKSLLQFLSKEEMITVKDYFKPALDQHLGTFIPKDKRNFFYITSHLDPRPLFSHFYHWFELAQMDNEPHPNEIRRTALLYNIFDSRNEGMATAVEELFMQAGLYDDSPRSREIVYILIAQRSARGLGSLYAHANQMSMEEAGNVHMEYTPRGWMKTEKELRIFEQHLYMRQPGYGTSYITGKYLIEHTIATMAKQKESKGEAFSIREFLDRMNSIGDIPVTLAHWELTGDSRQVREMFKK
jgi:hypothetical protein